MLFSTFNPKPIASASIAQVHEATLKNNENVIVKVVRPKIAEQINKDLLLMKRIAAYLDSLSDDFKRMHLIEIVNDYERVIFDELDLIKEASNAKRMRENFNNSNLLYIPNMHWDFITKNVLVMERVFAIPINNKNELKNNDIDFEEVATKALELFFIQVFEHNFFHADMHPGNIFVAPGGKKELPIIKVIDFGIMCSLTEFDQHYLADNLIAFLNRDYHRVAVLHIQSGWVPRETRVDELEGAIRTVCEPLLDRPMHEISLGELLQRLFQIARGFDVEIMPQLILLQKTIINIEGIGRQLYPQLDLWETARPELERWMNERMGVKGFIKGTLINLPRVIERLPELPNRTIDLIDKLYEGKIEMENKSYEIHKLRKEMKIYNRKIIISVIGSGFILSASIIYALNDTAYGTIISVPFVSYILGFFGLIFIFLSWKDK